MNPIQDIIRDAHALAQWTGAADLIRSGAETIARRLERLVERGLYITPKAALDVVAGERPLDKMLKTPMNEDTTEDICPTLNQFLNPGLKVDVPPAAEPVSPDAPEMKRGGKLVGIVCNKSTTLCYCLTDNLDIQVTARETNQGTWAIEGRSRNEVRIVATVFGGRWTAKTYAQFIRNGMVRRAMKHNPNRRAANPSNPSNASNPSTKEVG